ncbi:MAG: flagellar hook-length control protein FliK [Emcibacteraceae bacterium]|nr:flagellar hook-length control protein FliK [Emcibacteraceae bacterium]
METAEQAKMINEQISVAISKNIIKGQNNFNIRLKPAELGQVEIRIEFLSDGKMQASMMVENEKTLSMLQRDQSVLEKALQDAGINLSNKNMNFSLMKQDQQQSQKFAGLNNPANDDGSFEDMAQTETMQEIRMGYSNQAIDISV